VLICLLYIFEVVEFGVKTASGWNLGRDLGRDLGRETGWWRRMQPELTKAKNTNQSYVAASAGLRQFFPVIQLLFHADM
jgi:hypothetical protein